MDPVSSSAKSAAGIILIVDDHEFNRDLLAEYFSPYYVTVQAANGREGLEKVQKTGGALCAVLLDVMMPVMSGLEMLQELALRGLTKQIPVFLITGDTSRETIRRAYDLGVMDVIRKGDLDDRIVTRRVNSVVELFQARKKLRQRVQLQMDALSEQTKKILKLQKGMIEALSTAIEFRSCESGEHVRRISDITYHILRHAGLFEGWSDQLIEDITMASIMHDVGKISVPDGILNKPGRLTREEFDIMKTHTTKGGELLRQIPQMRELHFFQYAFDIAVHHHERWDGRGYPDGLKGSEIPLWAQVVSLADVYDALVSRRVYKPAFSFEKATDMITGGECGVFNPDLLESFVYIEPELRLLYHRT